MLRKNQNTFGDGVGAGAGEIMILVAMVVMMMGTLEELTGGTNNEAIVQLARAHVHHAAEVLRVLQYCYCVNPNATKFRKYWKSASAYNGVTPLV